MNISDKVKYLFFKFTPHLIMDRTKLVFAKVDSVLYTKIIGHNNIYVFLACDYANMGDYAITKAQTALLAHLYPDRMVHVFPMNKTYSAIKTILKAHRSTDLVTMIGGGNMSELYYGYERKRNLIVYALREYKIISFPQSIAYGNNPYGKLVAKRSAKTYSQHSNLTFMARENLSFMKMQSLFTGNKIVLTPDAVMTMDLWTHKKRSNIVVSIRTDREGVLSQDQRLTVGEILQTFGITVKEHDTCYIDPTLSLENGFLSLIQDYLSAKLVVTDRLHGMILAYVTGTPTIVFPNSNGKIEYGYKWIEDCNYIKLIDIKDIGKMAMHTKAMLSVCPDRNFFVERKKQFCEMFTNAILYSSSKQMEQ